MKKSILNLKGAQELSKNEQKAVNGGVTFCQQNPFCQLDFYCCNAFSGCIPVGVECPIV